MVTVIEVFLKILEKADDTIGTVSVHSEKLGS